MADSPLFVKTYDLLSWLIPQTQKFPKSQRFVLARWIQDTVRDFHALLLKARKVDVGTRRGVLLLADVELEKLRHYLRLSQEQGHMDFGAYEHGARMVMEVGKLLGAWRKRLAEGAEVERQ